MQRKNGCQSGGGRTFGPDVCGVRYRSAYNYGYSVALWDCDGARGDRARRHRPGPGSPPSTILLSWGVNGQLKLPVGGHENCP